MKRHIILLMSMLFLFACSKQPDNLHEDGHEAVENNIHEHNESEFGSSYFTEFTNDYEMFTEMSQLIVDKESVFVIHITKLSDYKPVTSGTLKIKFEGAINHEIFVDKISRTGIFQTEFIPETAGNVNITFIYDNGDVSESFYAENQDISNSIHDADNHDEEEHDNDEAHEGSEAHDEHEQEELDAHDGHNEEAQTKGITFLKEEAWKIDFGVKRITQGPFTESFKAVGKVMHKPSDEVTVIAPYSGSVKFPDKSIMPGKKVSAGSQIAVIEPGSIRDDNIKLRFEQAKSNFTLANKEFERVKQLYDLKIASEKELVETQTKFENAKSIYENLLKTSEGSMIIVKAPISGYIEKISVVHGQFIEAGSPIAIIADNKKMLVQIDIPKNEYESMGKIEGINFLINDQTMNLNDLNGKLTGVPVSSGSSGFVSLYFEINNKAQILPNSYLTLYLLGKTISDAISVPKSAIWEDQGKYFVFVQIHGELYEKREIEVSSFNGDNYLVTKGLHDDEVIVEKGVYRVMLASKSSALPSHGHTH